MRSKHFSKHTINLKLLFPQKYFQSSPLFLLESLFILDEKNFFSIAAINHNEDIYCGVVPFPVTLSCRPLL